MLPLELFIDENLLAGTNQPLTEMSTRNICFGIKAAGAYGWQNCHLLVPIISKFGSLNLLEPSSSQIDLHSDCLALVGTVTWQYHVEPKIHNSIPDMTCFPSRKPSHKFWNQISYVVFGYNNLFLVTNRVGHEADLSLPSSDVVKNEWNCTSAYSYISMLCTGENFLYILLY
jgi:hypothetical protein